MGFRAAGEKVLHLQLKNFDFIFTQNTDCEYMLDLPRRGRRTSKYLQSMFWSIF